MRRPVGAITRDSSVLGAVVGSARDADYLTYAIPGLKVRRVHYGIDPELFHDREPKQQVVSYIPRKLTEDAHEVIELLRLRGALEGWHVEAIDNVDEAAYAATLRRSAVFLSFGHREGFGLPPLEAMASGCIVVGFDGLGGHELFRDHGIAVGNGDGLALARAAERVLRDWVVDRAPLTTAARVDAEFVRATYRLERERDDVISAFGEFLAIAGGDDRDPSGCALPRFWRRPSRVRVAAFHVRATVRSLTRPRR